VSSFQGEPSRTDSLLETDRAICLI